MTVKEAIIAGLYPTNEDGHWLVPMRGGGTAEIASINGRKGREIIGYSSNSPVCTVSWSASGLHSKTGETVFDLMPPKAEPKAEAENGMTIWLGHTHNNIYVTTYRDTAERWSAHQTVYEIPNVKVFKP